MIYSIGIPPNVSFTAATVSTIVSESLVNVIVSSTAYPYPGFVMTTLVDADVLVVIVATIPVPEPDVLVCDND